MNIFYCLSVPLCLWIFEAFISVLFASDSHKNILDFQNYMNPNLTALKPLSALTIAGFLSWNHCRSPTFQFLDCLTLLFYCTVTLLLKWFTRERPFLLSAVRVHVQVSAWHLMDFFILIIFAATLIIHFYDYCILKQNERKPKHKWKS